MGINGLIPFLKKFAPGAFARVDLTAFATKRIAVDISLYLYKYKAIYGEDQWMTGIIHMMTLLRSHSIHPVVVFDGEAPPEKLNEQQARRVARAERLDKYRSLTHGMEQYRRDGTVSPDLRDFYAKSLVRGYSSSPSSSSSSPSSPSSVSDPPKDFDPDLVEMHLAKLKGQTMRVHHSDIAQTQDLMHVLRIPYFQAPGEAEGMCSWLSRRGLVDGVLTEDTDVLAYGASALLGKLDSSAAQCIKITYAQILDQLGMTQMQFTDLCIACGCDYNQRARGMGPVRMYKCIKQYGNLDRVSEALPNTDFTCLKYTRVRRMFSEPCPDTIECMSRVAKMWCGKPNYDDILAFMRSNSCVMYCHPQHIYNCCLQDARDDTMAPAPSVTYRKRRSPGMSVLKK